MVNTFPKDIITAIPTDKNYEGAIFKKNRYLHICKADLKQPRPW